MQAKIVYEKLSFMKQIKKEKSGYYLKIKNGYISARNKDKRCSVFKN